MLDALLYAVRDTIRAAGFGYGKAECEIMDDDGKPPPRCGNVFISVHKGTTRPGPANDNNLDEIFGFSVTVTMRLGSVSIDRVGDQLIARNLVLNPLGYRQGFHNKVEQLRTILHMNWRMTVLTGQTVPSANDNLTAWGSGSGVYGFVEPARSKGPSAEQLVGDSWFDADPGTEGFGVKAEMRFDGARRFQPVTAAVGPFV